MKTVTILELKAKAGELVRSVMRTGEEVQIVDNDEVVALLVSADEAKVRNDFKDALKEARATAEKYNIAQEDIEAEIRAVRRGGGCE
jgi:prevent-host-death family protein